MERNQNGPAVASLAGGWSRWLAACMAASGLVAQADVLVGINGDRYSGKIIQETPEAIVFESDLAGRLTIPRAKIRELQRTPPEPSPNTTPATNQAAVSVTNAGPQTNSSLWTPPGVGLDGHDWLQLKSGEWLKGVLKYVQNRKVEFDSDELEMQSLKLKDIRQIHTGRPMFTRFDGWGETYGTVVLSNQVVTVTGPEQVSLSRDQLRGITPGGEREISFWSGELTLGASLQSGNTRQAVITGTAELARRTPATQLVFDYLGNYSEVNGSQNANNHRFNGNYDIRLDRNWFVRPVQLEYYRDPLANISGRWTVGVGLGYYLFDRDDLEWRVALGPAFQFIRYSTVEPGEDEASSTPAGALETRFKADVTKRLKFIQSFSATFSDQESGRYSHHAVSTLEFEIKRHLNLDVSFVWDYLQDPQTRSDGTVPQHGDFYLTVGTGVRF